MRKGRGEAVPPAREAELFQSNVGRTKSPGER